MQSKAEGPATMTECRVPTTLRALMGVSGPDENIAGWAQNLCWVCSRLGSFHRAGFLFWSDYFRGIAELLRRGGEY